MGAGHSHADDEEDLPEASARIGQMLVGAVALIAVCTLVGLAAWWPRGDGPPVPEGAQQAPFVDAVATEVALVDCEGAPTGTGLQCREVRFRVTSGPTAGVTGSLGQSTVDAVTPRIETGDRIVLGYVEGAPEGFGYYFVDFQRRAPMYWLAGLFVLAVVALGRWQGLRALAGLVLSLGVLAVYLLPAMLRGSPPLGVALTAASVVAFGALYLAHGVSRRTTVALLGTFAALGVTAVLAVVFTHLARITGLSDENVLILQVVGGDVDARGLVLAGIVIGALGVLDDVTVTQVSAVSELHRADPGLGPRELYGRAIRIGRDHISSTVNTLVLAYAGAALPLLLLFTQGARPVGRVLTGEVVAIEVVRTLVGSIGLVSAVPLTTALAAAVVAGSRHGHHDDAPADAAVHAPDDPASDALDALGLSADWEPIDWDDPAGDDLRNGPGDPTDSGLGPPDR